MISPANRGGKPANLVIILALAAVALVGIIWNNQRIKEVVQPAAVETRSPAAEQEAAPTERVRAGDDLSAFLWKSVVYGALILAAIVVGARVVRRIWSDRYRQSSSLDIRILGRRYLSPKQSIAMVRVRGKELLLGITDHTIQTLYEFTSVNDDRDRALEKPADEEVLA